MIFTPRSTNTFRMLPILSKTAVLSGLLVALAAAPAFADDIADVSKLLRAGQHAQALGKADAYLSKNPRDAQMRFLKGVILTEMNKSSEAMTVFTKLTEDYPNLPEPYNNLAVLYAAAGQYEKARVALDAAIRTNPSYATAYENLGDIHAKLASQAYDKALQLDSGNSTAKSKLTLVRSLVGSAGGPAAPATASTTAPAPAPVQVAKEEPRTDAKPESRQDSKPEAKSESKSATLAASERDDVLKTVNGWASAWSARDVKAYLDYYGSDFQTPGGQSRKSWEEERRLRIAGKGHISVKVEAVQISVNGNTATVKFRQIYTSDRLTANSRKTLLLTKHHGGKWQIKQESTGS